MRYYALRAARRRWHVVGADFTGPMLTLTGPRAWWRARREVRRLNKGGVPR
ncbi:MAG: hypothetical protein M3Y33_17660 [Actinomycetota bacterium]|nr:hypothetical protein [Actinomycetota bacterium]